MALTDVAIRKAKPGPKPVKLSDGGGMHLLVTSAGGKLWRLKYRIDRREKLLAIGAYPEINLGEARRRREEAREMIALSKDAIERALAHGDSDKVRAAYHRGAHWDERVAMAQWWSDHLDQLRKGGDVVRMSNRTSR